MKKTIFFILALFICLQGFAQNKIVNKIDSTQMFIGATLKAIQAIAIESIKKYEVGQIFLSKEHPLVTNLMNFDDKDSYKIENYFNFGVFDNCNIAIYSKSSTTVSNFETVIENLSGSANDGQGAIQMNAIKSYIKSGDCNLKGNYSVNGNFIFFQDAKVLCENKDSHSFCKIVDGSTCYFNDIKFQYSNGFWVAKSSPVIVPIIDLSDITAFTDTSAKVDGYVVREGGACVSDRGICFSTSENPSITNNKIAIGQGRGSFKWNLSGLTANTTYYVRAYATNSNGTGYSNQIQFTTSGDNGTFVYSGKTYHFKKIGTQTWLTENLAYLPDEFRYDRYITYTTPEYSVADYSGNVADSSKLTENYKTYGVLYNWPAAVNACPCGWHLPSDEEWKILERYLGMLETGSDSRIRRSNNEVANQMKEVGTIHWKSPNVKSNNKSGFTALPGGYIENFNYRSEAIGFSACFWTSTEREKEDAWCRRLGYFLGFYGIHKMPAFKNYKYSVRCIKDETK